MRVHVLEHPHESVHREREIKRGSCMCVCVCAPQRVWCQGETDYAGQNQGKKGSGFFSHSDWLCQQWTREESAQPLAGARAECSISFHLPLSTHIDFAVEGDRELTGHLV